MANVDHRSATELDILLTSLQAEATRAASPHREALDILGLNRWGGTQHPYHDAAFKIWSALHLEHPDDVETIHHLAIMHHSRAMSLERSKSPKKSNDDWRKALELWCQLSTSDQFWDRLKQIASVDGDHRPIDMLRDELPVLVFRIHYDVVIHSKSAGRSRFHLNLINDAIEQAYFEPEAKEQAQKNAYEDFISGIDERVWNAAVLDRNRIKKATDIIEKYLELDPGCVPALTNALDFQVRLVTTWGQDWQAMGGGRSKPVDSPEFKLMLAERDRLLMTMSSAGEYWKQYFKQLVTADSLDSAAQENLLFWFRTMGDVHEALGQGRGPGDADLDQLQRAIEYYDQACRVSADDGGAHKQCVTHIADINALIALKQLVRNTSSGRRRCDAVQRDVLSPKGAVYLAQAYMRLNRFDEAKEICDRGLSLVYEFGPREQFDSYQRSLSQFLCRCLVGLGRVEEAKAEFFEPLKKALLASGASEPVPSTSPSLTTSNSFAGYGAIVGGSAELRQELSAMLANAAIVTVNVVGASVKSQVKEMLRDAVRLDASNTHAQENLDSL